MELGADGVLMNTAIALAEDPVAMATAMRLGGRSGPARVPRRPHPAQGLTRRRAARVEGVIAAAAAAGRSRRRLMARSRREPLEAKLRRLKKERDEADARYNEALTALDRALHAAAASSRIRRRPTTNIRSPPLNEAWNIVRGAAAGAGLHGRLAAFVWRIVGRRSSSRRRSTRCWSITSTATRPPHREAQRAIASGDRACLREQIADARSHFQSRLIVVPAADHAYVDTKDRDTAGRALVSTPRSTAWPRSSPSGGSRWSRASSGYERADARDGSRRRTTSCARSLGVTAAGVDDDEARAGAGGRANSTRIAGIPTAARNHRLRAASSASAFAPALDAYKYVGLRGPVPRLAGRHPRAARKLPAVFAARRTCSTSAAAAASSSICSRRRHRARGIDLNHEMVEVCRARGLDVTEADAVGYSRRSPTRRSAAFRGAGRRAPAAGLSAALPRAGVPQAAARRPIVLETLNPACWIAFFDSYIRDITHVWPLHPETLKYLVVASGFTQRGDRVPLAGAAARIACNVGLACRRRARVRRSRRSLQRQRRKAERADVHVPRLRDRRRQGLVILAPALSLTPQQ